MTGTQNMSSNFYKYWLWRSRVVGAIGAVLFLGVVYHPWLKDVAYSGILALFGLALMCVGVLDSFGVFQRKKIKQAIRDREQDGA